eukprot:2130699-Rhodomonas_salina.1
MVSPFSSEIAQDVTRNGRQVLAAAEKELAEGVEEVRVKEEQLTPRRPGTDAADQVSSGMPPFLLTALPFQPAVLPIELLMSFCGDEGCVHGCWQQSCLQQRCRHLRWQYCHHYRGEPERSRAKGGGGKRRRCELPTPPSEPTITPICVPSQSLLFHVVCLAHSPSVLFLCDAKCGADVGAWRAGANKLSCVQRQLKMMMQKRMKREAEAMQEVT